MPEYIARTFLKFKNLQNNLGGPSAKNSKANLFLMKIFPEKQIYELSVSV